MPRKPSSAPFSTPFYTAWTRGGILRFPWSPSRLLAHRPLVARLSERPDAPGADLPLPGVDQWGDVASPLEAARLLAWRWGLGEPVRRVEAVEVSVAR